MPARRKYSRRRRATAVFIEHKLKVVAAIRDGDPAGVIATSIGIPLRTFAALCNANQTVKGAIAERMAAIAAKNASGKTDSGTTAIPRATTVAELALKTGFGLNLTRQIVRANKADPDPNKVKIGLAPASASGWAYSHSEEVENHPLAHQALLKALFTNRNLNNDEVGKLVAAAVPDYKIRPERFNYVVSRLKNYVITRIRHVLGTREHWRHAEFANSLEQERLVKLASEVPAGFTEDVLRLHKIDLNRRTNHLRRIFTPKVALPQFRLSEMPLADRDIVANAAKAVGLHLKERIRTELNPANRLRFLQGKIPTAVFFRILATTERGAMEISQDDPLEKINARLRELGVFDNLGLPPIATALGNYALGPIRVVPARPNWDSKEQRRAFAQDLIEGLERWPELGVRTKRAKASGTQAPEFDPKWLYTGIKTHYARVFGRKFTQGQALAHLLYHEAGRKIGEKDYWALSLKGGNDKLRGALLRHLNPSLSQMDYVRYFGLEQAGVNRAFNLLNLELARSFAQHASQEGVLHELAGRYGVGVRGLHNLFDAWKSSGQDPDSRSLPLWTSSNLALRHRKAVEPAHRYDMYTREELASELGALALQLAGSKRGYRVDSSTDANSLELIRGINRICRAKSGEQAERAAKSIVAAASSAENEYKITLRREVTSNNVGNSKVVIVKLVRNANSAQEKAVALAGELVNELKLLGIHK